MTANSPATPPASALPGMRADEAPAWNASRMIREGRYPGKVCGAHGKRSGRPCQRPAVKGRERCPLHGGRRRRRGDPPELPPSARVIRNRNVKATRRAKAAAVQEAQRRGELHPDTMGVFVRVWASRVPEAQRPDFLLTLDQRIRGFISAEDWVGFIAGFR